MAEKIEDLNLPNAVVARIVKDCLPGGINVSKESRTAIAKAASVFVLYITSAANMIAMKNNKKTISGSDVINAMHDTEFVDFIEPLEEALENFKKFQKEKKDATAKRKQLIMMLKENAEQGSTENGTEKEVMEIDEDDD
ncbi:DNA polymerase epsilon subunit 3 [Schistocerca americana]|uniref:DNA polymerase epsilon subunit 3 n=1 Tax=Schistocerca americana TaxID=7009 RepID=UPI001F4FC932|nr:DNA polymerase epsilon subunit 3 [Schistocerca americana]XP_049960635.1 DNA polymerase epsilon subunit 3 [Schistocerca serialis cubense]